MPSRLIPVTARLVLASLLMMLMTMPALAQEIEAAGEAPPSRTWIAVMMAVLFALGVGLGCYMTPKRTHQD